MLLIGKGNDSCGLNVISMCCRDYAAEASDCAAGAGAAATSLATRSDSWAPLPVQ